jgi:2-oxoglutarate ferredoxin oxidoreductase subunit beta
MCPGCGNGIAMKSVIRAIDTAGIEKDDMVVVSGIGCSSRIPGYLDFSTLHGTHGRAIPFATGVKLAKPHLNVMVITGDGDALAIGGNHFIHACRRNIDITVVLFNNSTYGMTGGQVSPTTPLEAWQTTTPYGNIDPPFDICALAIAAGATFVARGTSYHTVPLERLITKALQHKGFALVEAIVGCHVGFGRKNRLPRGVDLLLQQKAIAVDVKRAERLSAEELEGKLITGILYQRDRAEYTENYRQLMERVQQKRAAG